MEILDLPDYRNLHNIFPSLRAMSDNDLKRFATKVEMGLTQEVVEIATTTNTLDLLQRVPFQHLVPVIHMEMAWRWRTSVWSKSSSTDIVDAEWTEV